MYFGEKVVFVWIVLSLFSVWRQGLWANVNPNEGGSVNNPWNTPFYCCVFWNTKECYEDLKNNDDFSCPSPNNLDPLSCYSHDPTFQVYRCDPKFEGPEYADSCKAGDEWPDCVMKDLRVNPTHKLSLCAHAFAIFLLIRGGSFWAFLLITVLTLI